MITNLFVKVITVVMVIVAGIVTLDSLLLLSLRSGKQ